jgi:trans-AT polyketide synthase/acyltransferase/oxidoreductase domain-containing protein
MQNHVTQAPPETGFAPEHIAAVIREVRASADVLVRARDGMRGLRLSDAARSGRETDTGGGSSVIGTLPPSYPEWLGDRTFCRDHGVRFPYVAGEMANGIATPRLVVAMARAEMLGFFGAAGLGLGRVEQGVDELRGALGEAPNWGVNLIHSPTEPGVEERTVDLLLAKRVPAVSASAFMDLTPAVVRCAIAGLHVDAAGRIVRRRRLFAKVSRPEVAAKFLSPAPSAMLRELVERGGLSAAEARLAERIPLAQDITVEADSGGHTDNRPLASLFPAIVDLRDRLAARLGLDESVRIGAAGGLGTPGALAAAFALGADYVVTGSVNQLAVEAGLSDDAKDLLGQADIADVTMAPAADMFELGVKVQVLRKGTMFAGRAGQLYEWYRDYPSLSALPAEVVGKLEKNVLGASVDEVWAWTRAFWQQRDPREVARAEQDPKHRMALVFRWYLGSASRWAIEGEPTRRTDYQIWCGPAVGAFNRWSADGFLARPANRSVVQIALNLLEGAAVYGRAQQARGHGLAVPAAAFAFAPRRLA